MTKKILVADDSVTIHMIINLTFAGEDVSVQAVTNGDRALEKTREINPDVILADVQMPGLGGYELCERIKSDPLLSGIPVILLASGVEPFDEDRARHVKCDGHLTKPFATNELIKLVHSVSQKKPDSASPKPLPTRTSESDRTLVSQRTRDSFLGNNRILDLFGILLPPEQPADIVRQPEPQPAVETEPEKQPPSPLVEPESDSEHAAAEDATEPESQAAAAPAEKLEFELSESTMNAIVERVVSHLSKDVIREVAWEVVPELAEIAIRQWLKENRPTEITEKTPSPAG
jgi:CheY-like chemotaxis protein